jgi:hypothetical protein
MHCVTQFDSRKVVFGVTDPGGFFSSEIERYPSSVASLRGTRTDAQRRVLAAAPPLDELLDESIQGVAVFTRRGRHRKQISAQLSRTPSRPFRESLRRLSALIYRLLAAVFDRSKTLAASALLSSSDVLEPFAVTRERREQSLTVSLLDASLKLRHVIWLVRHNHPRDSLPWRARQPPVRLGQTRAAAHFASALHATT